MLSRHFLLKYFLIGLTGILLLHSAKFSSGPNTYFQNAYSTYVELIILPHDTGLIKDSKPVDYSKYKKNIFSNFQRFVQDVAHKLLFSEYIDISFSEGQQFVNVNPVVIIIHKKHIPHQSSQDEVPPYHSLLL